jgi:TPR repeat protein
MAQNELGRYYEFGECSVSKDPAKAFRLYKESADNGSTDGLYMFGRCYADGIGVGKDRARAVKIWQEAADKGDGEAWTRLGSCYKNGEGVAKDLAKAKECYRRGIANGDWLGHDMLRSLEEGHF